MYRTGRIREIEDRLIDWYGTGGTITMELGRDGYISVLHPADIADRWQRDPRFRKEYLLRLMGSYVIAKMDSVKYYMNEVQDICRGVESHLSGYIDGYRLRKERLRMEMAMDRKANNSITGPRRRIMINTGTTKGFNKLLPHLDYRMRSDPKDFVSKYRIVTSLFGSAHITGEEGTDAFWMCNNAGRATDMEGLAGPVGVDYYGVLPSANTYTYSEYPVFELANDVAPRLADIDRAGRLHPNERYFVREHGRKKGLVEYYSEFRFPLDMKLERFSDAECFVAKDQYGLPHYLKEQAKKPQYDVYIIPGNIATTISVEKVEKQVMALSDMGKTVVFTVPPSVQYMRKYTRDKKRLYGPIRKGSNKAGYLDNEKLKGLPAVVVPWITADQIELKAGFILGLGASKEKREELLLTPFLPFEFFYDGLEVVYNRDYGKKYYRGSGAGRPKQKAGSG